MIKMKMTSNMKFGQKLFKRSILTLGFSALIVTLVSCRPWMSHSPVERAHFIAKRISKELKLNDAQKAVLEKIKLEVIAKWQQNEIERNKLFASVTELIKSENPDRAKIDELQKKHRLLRSNTEDFMLEKILEFHKILTPEQRAKAAEKFDTMRHRMHGD